MSGFGPLGRGYRYLQAMAHEQPVIFYSLLVGFSGPIAVAVVPPIRRSYGWKKPDRIPTTYPIPNRERVSVTGFDDEE